MSDLTEFLSARLDEDEALALSAGPHGRPLGGHWVSRRPGAPELHMYGEFGWTVEGADVETHDSEWGKAVADHIARHDPARVLADVQAKRAIVQWHESWPVLTETQPVFEAVDTDASSMSFRMSQRIQWMTTREYRERFGDDPPTGPVLRHLAAVYSDHPDYRDEWRP